MIRTLLAGTVVAALLVPLSGAVQAETNNFVTQEGADMWRASKLPGVAIYGPDNRKVGNISDVLTDHSGKATAIVIGVGGFLGIDQKDVAVPYDQVHFHGSADDAGIRFACACRRGPDRHDRWRNSSCYGCWTGWPGFHPRAGHRTWWRDIHQLGAGIGRYRRRVKYCCWRLGDVSSRADCHQ